MRVRIVVCDVIGNVRSVERALVEASRLRGDSRDRIELTSDPARVAAADKLVVPGQSHFGDYARALAGGLGDAIRGHLAAGRPFLGICLGLQILFASSDEAPGCSGLGVLPGSVVKLDDGMDTVTKAALKIPHTGWNVAERTGNAGLMPRRDEHFYFVHSFAVVPTRPADHRRNNGLRCEIRERRGL